MSRTSLLIFLSWLSYTLPSACQLIRNAPFSAPPNSSVPRVAIDSGGLRIAGIGLPAADIWLSTISQLKLPPIQHEYYYGPDLDCVDYKPEELGECRKWFDAQTAYRKTLERLFFRHWRIEQASVVESYATPAYRSLTTFLKSQAILLQPSRALPTARYEGGLVAEVFIPWEALPPLDALRLASLNIGFEDDGSDMTWMAVEDPPLFELTPCRLPLADDSGRPAYAVLGPKATVDHVFTFTNPQLCCGTTAYAWVREDNVSPAISDVDRYTEKLGPDEFLCGSPAAYRSKSRRVVRSDISLLPPPGFVGREPTGKRQVRRLPDGTRLILDGPIEATRLQSYTYCAACLWRLLQILALAPNGTLTKALEVADRIDGAVIEDYNFEISPDWTVVTEYRKHEGRFKATRHCLTGHAYVACGEEDPVPAPTRPLFHD